eukprot:4048161-Amphidinium_carterae.1
MVLFGIIRINACLCDTLATTACLSQSFFTRVVWTEGFDKFLSGTRWPLAGVVGQIKNLDIMEQSLQTRADADRLSEQLLKASAKGLSEL